MGGRGWMNGRMWGDVEVAVNHGEWLSEWLSDDRKGDGMNGKCKG